MKTNKLSSLLLADIPKYELNVPSSGKSIKYRPFLVKEEKVLLIAQESGSESEMIDAIKRIIESCTEEVTDAGAIPIFDVEYIFLQVRAKSVGEIIEPTIICSETGEKITLSLNISDITPKKVKNHTKEVKINDNIVVELEYPTLNHLNSSEIFIDYLNPSSFYDILSSCIVKIQTKGEVIDAKSLPHEEISEFVDNLTNNQFEKLLDFFLTSPRIESVVKYTTSDEVEREVVLSGLSDFFG